MQIGIGLPNMIAGTPGRVLLEWARRADDRGFVALATIDRVAYPSYESLIALAAAGAITERIELLTNVLLAPARNPILLAKEAASVDQLSGGRLTLGLGVGGRRDDYIAAEREFGMRGRRFDEALELMHGAWRGELVGGCPQPPTPKPTRGERVPILIGGTSEQTLERTVRWGVGWTAGGQPPEQVAPFAQGVREAWEKAGRDGRPRLVALSYFAMQEDRTDESRASILDYYGFLGDLAQQLADSVPRGADAVADIVRRFDEADMDQVVFHPTVADVREVDLLADALL